MKKAVESLTQELVAKQQRIEELQAELASKNIRIQDSAFSAVFQVVEAETEAAVHSRADCRIPWRAKRMNTF